MDIGIDPKTGKRKQIKRRGFTTKAEAEKACRELMNKFSKGLDLENENILFKEVEARWYKEYKQTVKASTLRARKSEREHLLNYFGNMRIKDINRTVYQGFLDHLRDAGYSYNTISGVHTTAGMIFKYARQEDLIIKSPTEFAKPQAPKLTVEELEALDEVENFLEGNELVEFLDLTEKHGLFLDFEYFCMAAFTGCRAGERLAGKWKDLCLEDCEPKMFKITKTLYCPKNKASDYYLLPPENIKKMDTRMRRILKRMNLNKKITQHTFRHTFTSLAAEAGVPLDEIQKILGHEKDEVTRKVYLHTTRKSKEKTSQQFNSFVNDLSMKIQSS